MNANMNEVRRDIWAVLSNSSLLFTQGYVTIELSLQTLTPVLYLKNYVIVEWLLFLEDSGFS